MLKIFKSIAFYFFIIYFFVVSGILFYGEKCVTAVTTSQGEFYAVNKLTIANEFSLNGKSVTYYNYNYEKELIIPYKAKKVSQSVVNGITNYYYYSPTLPRAVYIKNSKVNLHVAVEGDKVTVGTPLIFCGY